MPPQDISGPDKYLELTLTDALARRARRDKTPGALLAHILQIVIETCEGKAGIIFLKDEAAVALPFDAQEPSIHTTSELISVAWQGLPADYAAPSQIVYDTLLEASNRRFEEHVNQRCEILASKLDARPYTFRMTSDNRLSGAVVILSDKKERVRQRCRPLESALAESCKILEIITDWQLKRDLDEFTRHILLLQSEEPSTLTRSVLKAASQFLGCQGLSFFLREPTIDGSLYTLIGTYPKPLPSQIISYSPRDLNFTSLVLRRAKPCMVHYIALKRSDLTILSNFKWRDIESAEDLHSVMFVPITRNQSIDGLLKCTNKQPSSPHPYFSGLELYCAQVFAPLLLTWLVTARKEERFEYNLLDILHEIKVSVSGIKSAAKFVQKRIERTEDAELLHKLRHIKESAEGLVRLLPGLHRSPASAVAVEKAGLREVPFRPYADLCKPVCETHRQRIRERNIDLEILGQDQLGLIYAPVQDFRHVLQNIIDNAVKYTLAGRKLTVKIQRPPSGEEYAMIHVLSESLPIREDEREQIFKPGYRSIEARKITVEGEGRGLMIARAIARRYRGDVIYNKTGAYNIFTILIPRQLFRLGEKKVPGG